jgi:microcystin-dependent protein
MTEPFLGTIQYFAFGYAPTGWLQCNGSTVQVQQYAALYSLLGEYYGGNGTTNFNLPDLRGRTIIGYTTATPPSGISTYAIGASGGAETVAVPVGTLPTHNHTASLTIGADSTGASANDPAGMVASVPDDSSSMYASSPMPGAYLGGNVTQVLPSGGAPFSIVSPYLALTCCVCVAGYYPPRP